MSQAISKLHWTVSGKFTGRFSSGDPYFTIWYETPTCCTVWRTENGHEELIGVASRVGWAARMLADRLCVDKALIVADCSVLGENVVDDGDETE